MDFLPTDLLIGEAQALGLMSTPDGDVNYDGEMILFATSNVANSTVTWSPSRDGYIFGYRANVTSGFSIGINVDLPTGAGNPGAGSITTGLLDWTTAQVQSQCMQHAMFFPFHANDQVKVRTQSAVTVYVQLYVGYPRA